VRGRGPVDPSPPIRSNAIPVDAGHPHISNAIAMKRRSERRQSRKLRIAALGDPADLRG
jgi:hypothetical protein